MTREQLREDVEQARRELGDTVEVLAHKADVPTRVREAAQEGAARANAVVAQAAEKTTDIVSDVLPPSRRPYVLGALGVIVVALLVWRSRS